MQQDQVIIPKTATSGLPFSSVTTIVSSVGPTMHYKHATFWLSNGRMTEVIVDMIYPRTSKTRFKRGPIRSMTLAFGQSGENGILLSANLAKTFDQGKLS